MGQGDIAGCEKEVALKKIINIKRNIKDKTFL
jgi:hypothetical protein